MRFPIVSRLAMALVLTAGCVTTDLTPEAERVRITSNPEVVRPCKFVGEVTGADRMNGGTMGQGAAEENANRRLRNNAAAMGADTVFVGTSTTNTSGSVQRGEAYQCGTASSTTTTTTGQTYTTTIGP
jgi:uncharacterized protein YbjQ (UPF0145 family)